MDKGISPLIASVLLIAFTMTVAMTVGPFFTDTLKSTQKGTSENVEQVTKASNLRISLQSINYNGFTDQFELTVQNSGNEPFNNVSAAFFGQQSFNKEWTANLDRREIKILKANITNPELYDSLTLSLKNYPVETENQINTRKVKPSEEKRFIVNNDLSDSNLRVVSYADNNNIIAGSCSNTINTGQTHTFSSSCYSVVDTVTAENAFSAHYTRGGANGPVPESFAGKEFVYEDCRNGEYFNIIAPYESASVKVKNSTQTVATATISQGNHTEITTDIPDDSTYTITSDTSILVTYDEGGGDEYMMHPSSNNLWGVMESLTISKDNTYVEVWDSNGNKVKDSVYNKYDSISLSQGSSQGGSKTHHAKANKSALGAWRCADADNYESDISVPEEMTAKRFRLPERIEGIDNNVDGYYMTFTLTNSGKCTAQSSSGEILGSKSTTNNPPYPGFINFNSEEDFNITSRGILVECTAPAALQWEPSENEGESNLYGTMPTDIAELK